MRSCMKSRSLVHPRSTHHDYNCEHARLAQKPKMQRAHHCCAYPLPGHQPRSVDPDQGTMLSWASRHLLQWEPDGGQCFLDTWACINHLIQGIALSRCLGTICWMNGRVSACLRDSRLWAVSVWRFWQGGKRAPLAATLVNAWTPELLPARSAQGSLCGEEPRCQPRAFLLSGRPGFGGGGWGGQCVPLKPVLTSSIPL